jgi:5-(carboxyamino)imidazole ribonucleotide synthase
VIVARNRGGEVSCFDPVEMVFDNRRNILDYQLCPAALTQEQAAHALELAGRLARELELVGILAVEMFLTRDGSILINEMAPRPHNSGHPTMEACVTSQYEQLLRAISGHPLGAADTLRPSVMMNLLEPDRGSDASKRRALEAVLHEAEVHLHWYGKKGGRPGRKMGHLTILSHQLEAARQKADHIRQILQNEHES